MRDKTPNILNEKLDNKQVTFENLKKSILLYDSKHCYNGHVREYLIYALAAILKKSTFKRKDLALFVCIIRNENPDKYLTKWLFRINNWMQPKNNPATGDGNLFEVREELVYKILSYIKGFRRNSHEKKQIPGANEQAQKKNPAHADLEDWLNNTAIHVTSGLKINPQSNNEVAVYIKIELKTIDITNCKIHLQDAKKTIKQLTPHQINKLIRDFASQNPALIANRNISGLVIQVGRLQKKYTGGYNFMGTHFYFDATGEPLDKPIF